MTDNYCFICGHYLADAWSLNDKNKKLYLGDHTSNNIFESMSVFSKEPIIYEYSDKTEILYHSECHDILKKDCKYMLKWDDISEHIEPKNSHGLIPYTDLERPVDNSKIKTVVKWSKTQIIEEWEPIISEIREKKKDILQSNRESRREALRKQRQKKKDKIESLTTKIEKIVITIEKDKQSVLDKEDKMRDVKSEFKRTQSVNMINKLNLKVSKKEDLCKKEEDKLILLNKELDMFTKAWF